MKKNLLMPVLIGTLAFSLAGCGGNDAGKAAVNTGSKSNEAVTLDMADVGAAAGSTAESGSGDNAASETVAAGGTGSDAGEAAAADTATEDTVTEGSDAGVDDAVAASYTGTWVDSIAGRGYLTIEKTGNNEFNVQVNWSDSASETNVWNMTAQIDERNGNLVYNSGKYQKILFDENGNDTVEEETEVSGLFVYAEGGVHWTDSRQNGDAGADPTTFVREDDFVPGGGADASEDFGTITEEQALEAVRKYYYSFGEESETEESYSYWSVYTNENGEIVVLYRSYTGAMVRYYVDPSTGDTYVTEQVPGIIDEEQRTEETLSIIPYLY